MLCFFDKKKLFGGVSGIFRLRITLHADLFSHHACLSESWNVVAVGETTSKVDVIPGYTT